MSAQGQAPNADPFDVYFRRADLDRDGRISGQEAVGFLQGSGLPKNVLAQIWMHADQNRIGFLGRAEFYNALKLVTVAQKKRELTPDIVKAALYGPASARIPPPQINLAAVPAPSLPTGTASPSMQMGTSAPPASQNPGFRGPQVPPNPNLSQQYNNPSLENQLMRPPQTMSGGHASHSTHGVSGQGFPGGGTTVGPRLPNSSGALAGITSQVPNQGTGPSPAQDGIGPTVSGLTASRPPRPPTNLGLMQPETPAKDSRAPNASGNGFGADSIFGGDAFSATPSQTKQDSSAPAFSAGSLPVSSAVVSVSTGTQPSVKHSPVDSLHSSLVMQPGGQLQPAHSHMKPNQQASTQTTLTYPSSGVSLGAGNPASNQSHITWPKMTQSAVQKYTKVFLEVDTDRDGKITGEQARNLFLSWRLPREVLKQVWDLSDQDNDSMLSLKEFCAALYLMERYREGRPLPAVFPSSIMSDFPTIGQPTTGYNNAAWGPTSGWQQQHRTSGPGARQATPAGGVRQPMPPQDDEGMKPKQQKSKVPVLEKHLTDQLSKEEQEALNSKFREATEADKKVEELEKEILESKEKIQYYRSKMQELVLYKSRCDNRYNEITERVSGDKREVELLAKKYEEKCRQVGDVASKLTIEEATFRDIQERKMELYQAIVKMEQDGTADGILQVRADRVQSDLDELLKSLNDRCKKYGLRMKPTALVELPFGWQPGILEGAADWNEDWDKFEDEGFTFVKELTLDVQNVVAPPKQKSTPAQKEKASPVASPTVASSPNADVKSEKLPNMDEQVHENGSASHHNEDDSVRSVPGSPAARTGTESPSRELPDSPVVQTTDGDASPHAKEESQSDHGGGDSLLSGDKSFDEPIWGTFETNDDIDSVFGFNPTTKDKDHERQTDDYFFGSGDLGLNPIKTELPQTDGFFQKRSPFFDDSVPSTPLSTSGFSPPRYSQGSEHSFDLSRFDSFNMHDTGLFQPQENLSRFDSMRSTQDFDHGREFSRFDSMRSTQDFDHSRELSRFDSMRSTQDFDHSRELSRFDSMRSTQDFDQGQRTFARFDSMQSNNDFDHRYDFPSFDDPFGSGGQMSFESQTPRSSDNWSESQTPRRASDNWSETQTPRRTSDNWSESQTPRRTSDNWSAF